MRHALQLFCISLLVCIFSSTQISFAQTDSQGECPSVKEPTKVTWLGHSAFMIEASDKTILVDPWITGNPSCPITLDDIEKVDLILITHGHDDHIGDAVEIALNKGGIIVAQYEVALHLIQNGAPPEQVLNYGGGMNIGGDVTIDEIKITMVQAEHSSPVGTPAGYIIQLPQGITIYHAGDTGIFSSMALLGKMYKIHLALLPIGSVFTMGPYQAAVSLRMLRPKVVIPMHYGTFPILEPDASNFIKKAKKYAPKVKVKALNPGEFIIR